MFDYPEYKYFWLRHAYNIRRQDILISKTRRRIELKYKSLFINLDLDWNGYLELNRIKDKEIAQCVAEIISIN